MRSMDSEDLPAAPAKPNGTPNVVPPNGGKRKRGAAKSSPESATDPEKLAGFAVVETPAMDAQMWPVHAISWLQPDVSTAPPRSSGLRIERRRRVPTPDFIQPVVAMNSGPLATAQDCEPMPPNLAREIPRCDLSPLGWDPRTVCGAAGKEILP